MLCRSGPGAPSFDVTFCKAESSRSQTSSIVTNEVVFFVRFDFGVPRDAG